MRVEEGRSERIECVTVLTDPLPPFLHTRIDHEDPPQTLTSKDNTRFRTIVSLSIPYHRGCDSRLPMSLGEFFERQITHPSEYSVALSDRTDGPGRHTTPGPPEISRTQPLLSRSV